MVIFGWFVVVCGVCGISMDPIEITGSNWYCFIFKNVENCKDIFQRVKKL